MVATPLLASRRACRTRRALKEPQPALCRNRSRAVAGACSRLLLALACCGPFLTACGGDYLIKTWGVDDGLPGSGVTDVSQSAEGYLWVGTLTSGLSRFDGVRFVNFDSVNTPLLMGQEPGGRYGGVRRLFADGQGTLWINGFGKYLASWRAGRFQLEYAGPVVISALVRADSNRIVFAAQGSVLQGTVREGTNRLWKQITPPSTAAATRFWADRAGNVWYRRTDRWLARLHEEQTELVRPPVGPGPIAVLAGDERGCLAVGVERQLLLWRTGHFEDLTPTNGETELTVRGLVSDGLGGWWVEANHRLRRCQGRQWVAEAADWAEQQRVWGQVRSEQPDGRGGLWFAYVDGGLVHISSTGQLSALTTRDGLPSNRLRTLFQDRENNLWASFERGGLARVRPRCFCAVGKGEGLADTVTTSVCEDRAGAVWIGTVGGSVARWLHGTCTNFTLPHAGTRCEKSLVFPAPDGRVWISTHGNGLLVYEDGAFRSVLPASQAGMRIGALLVDRRQRVWMAGEDGLAYLDGTAVRQVLTVESEPDYPTSLAESADGAIWIGMNTGKLLRWAKGALTTFQPGKGLPPRRFSALLEDAEGNLWIGTLGTGLLCFRQGRFRAITTSEGLPTDAISQVLEDAAGNLWFGSRAGVFSVNKAMLTACAQGQARSVTCRLYGRDDGLPTLGCAVESQPTAWRGRDGRLWFATADGLACVQPHELEANPQPPLVAIEEVWVDGRFYASASGTPAGAKLTGGPLFFGGPAGELDIGPGRHQLQFRYTGLSFTAPDHVRFKYRLEGLDPQWSAALAERSATYNSVPAGQYRFCVLACNSDGVWSGTEASLPLAIRPYLWERRWFRLGAFLAVLLSVAGSVFWVLHRRHHRQLRALTQQHALERERARIAQDLHDDLGAGLAQISFASAMAQNPALAADGGRELLGEIGTRARELVSALDEIVWAVNPKNDSLPSLSSYFCQFAQSFLKNTAMSCRLELAANLPATPLSSEQRHHLFLAFKEALHNAARHSGGSVLGLSIQVEDEVLCIALTDNGCGVPPGQPPPNADGLAGMRQRLQNLGGRCEVSNPRGSGTRVVFRLPLRDRRSKAPSA